jgi:hypothetical protein
MPCQFFAVKIRGRAKTGLVSPDFQQVRGFFAKLKNIDKIYVAAF